MTEEGNSSQSQNPYQRLSKKIKKQQIAILLAPNTDITDLALSNYDQIRKSHQFVSFQEADKSKTYLTAKVQKHTMPHFNFNQQMHRFRREGYCADPDPNISSLVFGQKQKDLKQLVEQNGMVVTPNDPILFQKLNSGRKDKTKKQITRQIKQKRIKDQTVLGYQGPWSGYGQNLENGALTVQQKQKLQKAQQIKQIKIQQAKIQQKNFQPYQIFHWKQYHDYKGLSYVEPPVEYKKGGDNCYIPKKQVFSWRASRKQGILVSRFFPKTGHFFLLATPQGKVHLYDVMRDRSCAHSYIGHSKAVRDIQFSHNGKQFLSAGFDGKVLSWDTQYGKVKSTFNLKRIPYVIKYHPLQMYPNVFFVGSSLKTIYQLDLRTGTKMMEYTQHLGTVNTLTFIQENKFVSSSDDKKLFIWQYGVPVVTRHVSEPQMHTITATAMHPSGQFYAGQSSDNQIVIYENKGGNFRRLRAKTFASHYCAGYACAIDFSYDGQFIISGDERGKLFFYDWKTSKVYRIIDGHPGACISIEWHPCQPTTVVSCGWDGSVKLWQ